MTHHTETDFSKKHPKNKTIDPAITNEVKRLEKNGELPCAVAFDIASKNNVSPQDIGMTLDLLNIRLTKCQLGLFGYHPSKKIVTPLDFVDNGLAEEIKKGTENNRLACKTVWDVALRLNVRKMTVSNACESLGVKIKPCQLGAF